ncbi:ABC transporter permease/substrate-binding protein [Piscinibacter terrae]|uniref:ABC transporter permease subunit n=1 Tax=Piscinibacter terrae TaxID=2496871 RepID=A0A3N7HTX8_9BURK|nr:glycine betaine ABC transporter substrate-binding protein [Albitalea terrae]RQP25760.1 ABC transporter permease subunit [Albitalea terrae]
MSWRRWLVCALALGGCVAEAAAAQHIVIGSKRFTESYILGEIVRQTLQDAGIEAEHKQGLGNTGILEQALATGAVDVYPEYTGTIVRELLKKDGNPTLAQLNEWLAPRGLKAAVPLGFNNTYALAMPEAKAAQLGVSKISDLLKPQAAALRFGLSHEFLARADGWPALKAAYKLPMQLSGGIDHGIAYDAIASGRVDVIDIYSTDAKVGRYALRVLQDDLNFFPKYDAVLLMRSHVDPAPLRKLEGRIDEKAMIALNAQVELDGLSFAEAARRFVKGDASLGKSVSPDFWHKLFADDFARLLGQHLLLVFGSLLIAVLVGVPLGIAAFWWRRASPWVLAVTGVLQTVPSLALLAFLIAIVGGIGLVPAVLALCLYALLPIVRNTFAGLQGVGPAMRHAALSLGLTRRQSLRHVELPLARPMVMAGIKTAAVINVGTATVAAFIGAGGFGERIVAGLAVNDTIMMLAGALPSAALALIVQFAFDRIERQIAPPVPELGRGIAQAETMAG